MPLDPVLHPVDPDRRHPLVFAPAAERHRPQADTGLCHESRQAPRAGHARSRGHRLAPPPRPAEPDPDSPSPSSSLMLDDIEARLADAPRDDISGLRWMVNLYQRLLDMVLNQPDAPESTRRRQWQRLRNLQRRLRSATSRPASRQL